MKCHICNGIGEVDNPRFYNRSCMDAYFAGIPTRIKCKHCGGYGFVINNINEIIPTLQMAVNDKRGLTAMETKQIFDTLNNHNNDSTNKRKNQT